MTRLQNLLVRLAPLLLLVAVAMVVAACVPGTVGPGGSASATPIPSQAPLEPAQPGADPVSLLAWLFTPIFQALFITLTFFNELTGNIVVAILLLTVVLKVLTTPLTRKQLVSSRQTQLLQPEIKAIQAKYKGDRVKQQAATQEYYKQRGISPAGGCLPTLLTMGLLIPMYSVISQGLTNYDPSAMWHVFGVNLFPGIICPPEPIFNPTTGHVVNACLEPFAFGINWGIPEPDTTGLKLFGFGISILAIVSSLLQLVQSRMALPPHDPRTADDQNVKIQRQMAYFLPLISILYGSIIPAGLFLYWIASTLIQSVQQYLFLGWGGMFPLFGWHPAFARNHSPRFVTKPPEPKPIVASEPTRAPKPTKAPDRDLSAQSTIRTTRKRSGRRGRRR